MEVVDFGSTNSIQRTHGPIMSRSKPRFSFFARLHSESDTKKAKRASLQRRLRHESLEDRRLMALDIVADITTTPKSSDPAEFVQTGSSFYYVATGPQGREVHYKIDSPQNPGFIERTGSFDLYYGENGSYPKELTIFGDYVYFSADTLGGLVTGGGREVWRAKEDVVTPLMDIVPGINSSDPEDFTVVGNTLYFTAKSPGNGRELWKTDGTTAGTKMVHDIYARSGASSNPKDLVAYGGVLYFTADDGETGRELWRTDGTVAGTKMVRDIQVGAASSNPTELTVAGNKLFFAATRALGGREIWSSDGTYNGTQMLRDIAEAGSGLSSSNPEQLTAVGDNLYFTAETFAHGRELYRYDPSVFQSVFLVKDINVGNVTSDPVELTAVGSTLYFVANSPSTGRVVWKSGGTNATTLPAQGWNQAFPITSPSELTDVNGTLYFSGFLESVGQELFKSNGTSSTTQLVKNINAGAAWSDPKSLAVVNGKLHFAADDGVQGAEHLYVDNWGMVLPVYDNWQGNYGSTPAGTAVLENEVYFTAADKPGYQLFKHNPTSNTLTKLTDFTGYLSTHSNNVKTVGNSVFFVAYGIGFQTLELWKTTGTSASNTLVKSISATNSTYTLGSIQNMTTVGNVLYFTVAESSSDFTQKNVQLWKSDGTTAGTVRLSANTQFNDLNSFTAVGNRLYFVDLKSSNEQVLWKSEGSNASTSAIVLPALTYKSSLIAKDNQLYFFSRTADVGTSGLYRTDGTTNGTQLIKGLLDISGPMININQTLYFAAQDGSFLQGYELFKSDGTSAGTSLVKDIFPAVGSTTKHSFPNQFANVNGKLYFTAESSTGRELWTSDGTKFGTKQVQDVLTGNASSNPSNLVNANGKLYFTATTIDTENVLRVQVMMSDGTDPGTMAIPTLDVTYEGIPQFLTPVGDALFFSAIAIKAHKDIGYEPMIYKPDVQQASAASVDRAMASGFEDSIDYLDFDTIDSLRKKAAYVRN
jgi:ELWxxDGT repeat protein